MLATIVSSSLAIAETQKPSQVCEENLVYGLLNKRSFSEALGKSPALKQIQELLTKRTPEEQARINEKLTKLHAAREMTFQVKNPKTGRYDKFVAVPVDAEIAAIDEHDFHRLVNSTVPVMHALRELLQKIYSQPSLTIESLGLTHLPPDEATLMLKVIKESIYLEPKMISPAMKDYPFLPVAAFDGAVVDPTSPKPEFFELNLGTPSGLSNNKMLLQELADADPELYSLLAPQLTPDHTFEFLRKAIESAALKWTKNRSGISVVISPGVYNGAHPDVAMISKMTGLPLVKSSDLYEDAKGNIRLNLNAGEGLDPIVTGIYGRMEESFFLQSNEDQIPMISPIFQDNAEIGRRLGFRLRPGADYDFKRDNDGHIIGVEKNQYGEPLYSKINALDTIGPDPYRQTFRKGSFRRAILNRKLFYSAIGGRVVDDKRLFPIIAKYLVKDPDQENLARPIKSLKTNEFDFFYQNPSRFVVKEPNNSGGVGIYFPRAMLAADVAQLIETVKKAPENFKIEYVSDIVTLPNVQRNESGQWERKESAIDLRLFVTMDANGNVNAGANSILLRVASNGGLYSNTSRGGGYGVGIVARWHPPLTNLGRSARSMNDRWSPSAESSALRYGLLTPNKDRSTAWALQQMHEMDAEFNAAREGDAEAILRLRETASSLSFTLRELMDGLSGKLLEFIGTLREFSDSEAVDARAIDILKQYVAIATRELMKSETRLRESGDMRALLYQPSDWTKAKGSDPVAENLAQLPTKARLRPLPFPEVTHTFEDGSTGTYSKVELAEYLWVDDPEVQKIISDVQLAGGQVRLVKKRFQPNGDNQTPWYGREEPYFWVSFNRFSSGYLVPVIAIDLSVPHALPALEHEYAHFKLWLQSYQRLLREGQDRETAADAANKEIWTDEYRLKSERLAVDAEMAAEVNYRNSPYNDLRVPHRPHNFYDYGFINRVTYPEFEALRLILERKDGFDQNAALKYMRELVDFAVETRHKAIRYIRDNGLPFAAKWENSTIFSLLAEPYGFERLEQSKTIQTFVHLLQDVCKEKNISEDQCGGSDRVDAPAAPQQQQ